MGYGTGFERGAQALSNNLMAGIGLGMQQQRYDQYDQRYKDSVARDEKQFNRKMEIERGKLGLPPSYHEQAEVDPQEQANQDLQANVMAHQDFSARPDASIPSAAHIAQPTQVGRLALPGRRMMHTSPGFPSAPASPGVTPMALPGREGMHTTASPAATLARPSMSEGTPTDPSKSLFGGGSPSVRRQPMMPRFARPRR